MKRLLLFLVILAMASGADAADPTTEMLNAPFVGDYITLSLGPGNDGKTIVKYTIDTNTSPRAVAGKTFRSNDEVAIHIQSFNPLTQAWVVEAKATPDVSYAAIKAFLDDLTALQAALPQPPGEDEEAPPVGGGDEADDCERLKELITEAFVALKKEEVTASDLRELVTGATGHAGVTKAAEKISTIQSEIDKNIDKAKTALSSIQTEFSGLTGNEPTKSCPSISAQILVDYIQVHSTADRIIETKETLHAQLGDLHGILQPYLQTAVWRGQPLTDLAIKTVNPTFAEQQSVSVTAKERTVQLVDNSIVIKTDDANVISGKFDVRKSSFFVAERAVAVIYNSLTYPQYGTATNEAGETVVRRTDDHEPVNGALMLNLVMRLGRSASVVHPLLQLGVSSAKDYPGFLAGVGLRFVEPFNFSLSVGGMITRYKDLDGDLAEDDPVSGTAEIEEHLTYKTSPVALYGAVQLKF